MSCEYCPICVDRTGPCALTNAKLELLEGAAKFIAENDSYCERLDTLLDSARNQEVKIIKSSSDLSGFDDVANSFLREQQLEEHRASIMSAVKRRANLPEILDEHSQKEWDKYLKWRINHNARLTTPEMIDQYTGTINTLYALLIDNEDEKLESPNNL